MSQIQVGEKWINKWRTKFVQEKILNRQAEKEILSFFFTRRSTKATTSKASISVRNEFFLCWLIEPTNRSRFQGKKHKLGHLRVDQQGNMTFKRLPTNQLVQALQLGIQHAVGGLETQPTHDILIHDFQIEEIVEFPKFALRKFSFLIDRFSARFHFRQGRGGLKATPAHRFNDFTMRCYAPAAFRHFRTLFHIRPEDFLVKFKMKFFAALRLSRCFCAFSVFSQRTLERVEESRS